MSEFVSPLTLFGTLVLRPEQNPTIGPALKRHLVHSGCIEGIRPGVPFNVRAAMTTLKDEAANHGVGVNCGLSTLVKLAEFILAASVYRVGYIGYSFTLFTYTTQLLKWRKF